MCINDYFYFAKMYFTRGFTASPFFFVIIIFLNNNYIYTSPLIKLHSGPDSFEAIRLQCTWGHATGPLLPSLFTSQSHLCQIISSDVLVLPGGSGFGTQPNPCSAVNASPPTGTAANVHTRTKTETYFYGDELRLSSDKHAVSYSWLQRCGGILWLSHHGAQQERQRRLDNSIPEAQIKSESLFLTIAE